MQLAILDYTGIGDDNRNSNAKNITIGFPTNVNAGGTGTKKLKIEEVKGRRSVIAMALKKHYKLCNVSEYNSDDLTIAVEEYHDSIGVY